MKNCISFGRIANGNAPKEMKKADYSPLVTIFLY